MAWETLSSHADRWGRLTDTLNLGRVKRYPVEILSFIASIVTIVTFLVMTLRAPRPEFWYVLVLLAYVAVAVTLLIVQSVRYARKARYAEAIRAFHPIAHIMRDAQYHVKDMGESDFKITLEKVLSAFAVATAILTGTKTRACVKLLRVDGGVDRLLEVDDTSRRSDLIYADLYVRDGHSVWPSKHYTEYPLDKDRLSKNSAFCSLLRGDADYYFENNIPRAYKSHRYESSSFTTYCQGQTGRPGWVLPYRSTILWPIRKLVLEDQGEVHRERLIDKHDLLGFLCIDSPSRNVWTSRYDGQIGAAVADFLYAFMDLWFAEHLARHPAKSSAGRGKSTVAFRT